MMLAGISSIPLFSQENGEFEYYRDREVRTLFGRDRDGGVYCAFYGGYSQIDSRNAVMFGGRFGWLAGHSIGVGLGATGFLNEYHFEPVINREAFLAGGYGGLFIEPILFPRWPVHLSFPVLLGAGGISYVSKEESLNENMVEDSEVFLVAEPAAEIEFNMTRFFRLSAGASYRFTTPFNVGLSGSPSASSESIEGISYTLSLKFGRF